MPVAYVRYVAKILAPSGLAPFYPHPEAGTSALAAVGAAAALLAATALALRALARRPHLTVGWLWFAGVLVPMIGVVQVGSQALADRYAYLPIVGLATAAAFEARARGEGRPRLRAALAVAAVVIPLGLGALAAGQRALWSDTRTLFEHTLRVTAPQLLEQAQSAGQGLTITKRSRGGFRLRGELDDELGATLLTALDPLAAPRPATDGTPDQRSVPARYADALGDLLQIALSSGQLPTSGGARPTVVVTVDLATLRRELGTAAGELRWAGPISAEAARRLACDAGIVPAVLGAAGEPLDVGRLSYPVTAAIRRALEVRDGGCAFPGCHRPPPWCAAHHILHWTNRGITAMSNLVLLCGRHHVVVHHQGWTVRIAENGLPEFTPPPWIDPDQVPITTPWRTQLAKVPTTPAPTEPPARPPTPHPRT